MSMASFFSKSCVVSMRSERGYIGDREKDLERESPAMHAGLLFVCPYHLSFCSIFYYCQSTCSGEFAKTQPLQYVETGKQDGKLPKGIRKKLQEIEVVWKNVLRHCSSLLLLPSPTFLTHLIIVSLLEFHNFFDLCSREILSEAIRKEENTRCSITYTQRQYTQKLAHKWHIG